MAPFDIRRHAVVLLESEAQPTSREHRKRVELHQQRIFVCDAAAVQKLKTSASSYSKWGEG
jgi:hypothetical protein